MFAGLFEMSDCFTTLGWDQSPIFLHLMQVDKDLGRLCLLIHIFRFGIYRDTESYFVPVSSEMCLCLVIDHPCLGLVFSSCQTAIAFDLGEHSWTYTSTLLLMTKSCKSCLTSLICSPFFKLTSSSFCMGIIRLGRCLCVDSVIDFAYLIITVLLQVPTVSPEPSSTHGDSIPPPKFTFWFSLLPNIHFLKLTV